MTDPVRRYHSLMYTVPGWFDYLDALVLSVATQAQHECRIAGDVLEIGAFQGRSAILLGMLLAEDERLTVCDLWEQPPPDALGKAEAASSPIAQPSRGMFEANWLRFHDDLPTIAQCPSIDLRDSLDASRPWRMVHVDGSHLFDAVRADINLALKLLHPSGLLVLDDVSSASTPGVAAAAWEAALAGEFRPVIMTKAKMYATSDEVAPDVIDCLYERLSAERDLRVEWNSSFGKPLMHVSDARPLVRRLAHRAPAAGLKLLQRRRQPVTTTAAPAAAKPARESVLVR